MLNLLRKKFPYFDAQFAEQRREISRLHSEIEKKNIEHLSSRGVLKNKLQENEKVNEHLLVQLYQIQEEIDKPSQREIDAVSQCESLGKDLEKVRIESLEKANQIASLKREIQNFQQSLAVLKIEADGINTKNSEMTQNLIVMKSSLEKKNLELEKRVFEKLENANLIKELELKLNESERLRQSEIKSISVENERLLKSLHRAQEELENIYIESKGYKAELDEYLKKWQKLEARMPNYLDVGSVKIKVGNQNSQDELHFLIDGYQKGSVKISSFTFSLQDLDGNMGISIDHSSQANYLYPSQVAGQQSELAKFLNLKNDITKKIDAAINVIEFSIRSKWQEIDIGASFDPVFWNATLIKFISDYKKLPSVFRYDYAKLKMEVNNVDYENVWIELHRVGYGSQFIPKLEVRIAGAMITPGQFSRFPKIEIPLIDGIEKPFNSWFPESSDAYGQKLEFRFDLDRRAMDAQAWTKLAATDMNLCLGLIGALPRVIEELKNDKVLISRPWENWSELMLAVIQVINAARKPKTSVTSNDALPVKPIDQPDELQVPKPSLKKSSIQEYTKKNKITITKTKR